MPDNIPDKHHYLPQFYLSRWASDEGKLTEFSVPNPASGLVVPQRRVPKGTGYGKGIYSFANMPPEKRSLIESKFMHRIDTDGAVALDMLERPPSERRWTKELRQAWILFMISIFIRNPVDIEHLKIKYANDWRNANEEWEAAYQKQRRPDDPATAAEYFNSFEQYKIENFALNLLPRLVDLPRVGQKLLNMHWFTTKLGPGEEFLTSDRPVIKTHLDHPDAYWLMPIGPDRLFMAVHTWRDELRRRAHTNYRRMVEDTNKSIVARAEKLAFGRTDRQRDFVQRYLKEHTVPSLFALGQLEF